MFYRYAYIGILAAITLAVAMARMSYTVTLYMLHPTMPSEEIGRMIAFLDLPRPRTAYIRGRDVVIKFHPFFATEKKEKLEALLKELRDFKPDNVPLDFNIYLNEPDLQLFNYMFKEMGGRNFGFRVNPQIIKSEMMPYSINNQTRYMCILQAYTEPTLPNFNVSEVVFSKNIADEKKVHKINYLLSAKNRQHNKLAHNMMLATSRYVTFITQPNLELPPQAKDNLHYIQKQCNEELLKQEEEFIAYVLFPTLSSQLRRFTIDYDFTNNILR